MLHREVNSRDSVGCSCKGGLLPSLVGIGKVMILTLRVKEIISSSLKGLTRKTVKAKITSLRFPGDR